MLKWVDKLTIDFLNLRSLLASYNMNIQINEMRGGQEGMDHGKKENVVMESHG